MECSCVESSSAEVVKLIKEGMPIATKMHKCSECSGIIAVGTGYYSEVYTFDGEINTHKTCLDCLSLRNSFFDCGWCYTMVRSDIIDHIYESEGDVSEKCMCSLTDKALAWVCQQIENVWERLND